MSIYQFFVLKKLINKSYNNYIGVILKLSLQMTQCVFCTRTSCGCLMTYGKEHLGLGDIKSDLMLNICPFCCPHECDYSLSKPDHHIIPQVIPTCLLCTNRYLITCPNCLKTLPAAVGQTLLQLAVKQKQAVKCPSCRSFITPWEHPNHLKPLKI